jgi:hypothetical protein
MRADPNERCYWKHERPAGGTFPCLDGRSQVCARCCVERCAVDTPEWFARCASAGHPTWPAVARLAKAQVAPKLVCLESYWDRNLFREKSVKGFLESLGALVTPPLQVAHRFVESRRGFAYYTRHPDGLLWREREAWNAPIFYLAFHGAPGTLKPVLDPIGAERLCEAFRDFGAGGYRNLVYFGSCSVLRGRRGERFARRFLEASGCQAIVGYTTDVDWMTSLVADLMFLQRFYSNRDPWGNLTAIFDSVQRDFPPARAMGHVLVTPDAAGAAMA